MPPPLSACHLIISCSCRLCSAHLQEIGRGKRLVDDEIQRRLYDFLGSCSCRHLTRGHNRINDPGVVFVADLGPQRSR